MPSPQQCSSTHCRTSTRHDWCQKDSDKIKIIRRPRRVKQHNSRERPRHTLAMGMSQAQTSRSQNRRVVLCATTQIEAQSITPILEYYLHVWNMTSNNGINQVHDCFLNKKENSDLAVMSTIVFFQAKKQKASLQVHFCFFGANKQKATWKSGPLLLF